MRKASLQKEQNGTNSKSVRMRLEDDDDQADTTLNKRAHN